MSKFETTLDSALARLQKKLGRELSSEEVEMQEGQLFEQWIKDRRFDDLIAHIQDVHELDGGGVDCVVLGKALRDAGEVERIHALFRGLIASRTRAFWKSWPDAQAGKIGQMRDAAKHMASAMAAYAEYWHNLWALKLEQAGAELKDEALRFQSRTQLAPQSRKRGAMTEKVFWELIAAANADAGSETQFADSLEKELLRHTATNIIKFDELLHARLDLLNSRDLWAFAYLACGGCSDDSFDYFRAWIVARGKAVFDAAVRSPAALLQYSDGSPWGFQCEQLLSIASDAYQAVAGMAFSPQRRPPAPLRGSPWEESDLAALYPDIHLYFQNHGG
jgi:hypothetical protein